MQGKALVMITEWDNGNFTAEIYPFGGKVIAQSKSLPKLLERLSKKTNVAKIPRLKED